MKDISQEEFEEMILAVLNGKYTRADLIRILRVDRITLNNKIQELFVLNRDLYTCTITDLNTKLVYSAQQYVGCLLRPDSLCSD